MNTSGPTTYPPDISCFDEGYWDPKIFKARNCSVTDNMVGFLNLTGPDLKSYLSVYCLNPPSDDVCPFYVCPNADIAGPLVRIANYVTGFCLVILMFYSSRRVKEAFWSQSLITYSLLITCSISLLRGDLTRFHSMIVVSIVCSPANVYFAGYSIRAFWSSHRLDAVLGKKQVARRAMVFFSVAIWTAILIYAYLPPERTKFSQDTCRMMSNAEGAFLLLPIVLVISLAEQGPVGVLYFFMLLAAPILIAVAWAVAITRRRKEIWPPGEPYRPRFGKVWRTVVARYPFLLFLSVVVIPTLYWVLVVELGVMGTPDNTFSLTFGQVLAVFMAVPPIIEVAHSLPQLWRWLINLSLVRYITRRPAPEVPGPEEMGTPNAESTDWQNNEKKRAIDSRSSTVTEQPRSSQTQQPDGPKGVTEHGES